MEDIMKYARFILTAVILSLFPGLKAMGFVDDFEDGIADGWIPTQGSWEIVWEDGNHGYVYQGTATNTQALSCLAGVDWKNAIWEADIKTLEYGNINKCFQFRRQNSTNWYAVTALSGVYDSVRVRKMVNGVYQGIFFHNEWFLASEPCNTEAGVWYHIRVKTTEDNIKVWVDGNLVMDFADVNDPPMHGTLVCRALTATDLITPYHAQFDNVSVTPIAISGVISPAYSNLTVDLFHYGEFAGSTLTNGSGQYAFSDLQPGDYNVELVVPLGFTVDQNNVPVLLDEAGTVNFALSPIVTSNQARGLGYWKHQVNANLSGNGATDYTTAQLLAFSQDIFDHFYSSPANPIQVSGATYVGSTAHALTMSDLQVLLNINQGGSTKYQRACQHYLTLLLNVVSNKLGQYMWASNDHATISQAIIYINQLLTPVPANSASNELAKNLSETLSNAQTVSSGVIPLTTPNVIFSQSQPQNIAQVSEFHLGAPTPNPFNPTTSLSYTLPEAATVNLQVFDLSGRIVATIVSGLQAAGSHAVTFDGSGLASGVYLYHLQAGERLAVGKMLLLK
jgi:hypothetical protein